MQNKGRLVSLPPDQLHSLIIHLEQTVVELRKALEAAEIEPLWVQDLTQIETMYASSEALLRELRKSLKGNRSLDDSNRGKPRRTGRKRI